MTDDTKATILILVVALALGMGFRVAWAQLVYSDPECAITECVRVKP